jgi:hypothetical protein
LGPTAALALLAAGCGEVPTAAPDTFAIDTGEIGRIMPGAFFLLSWPAAAYRCKGAGAEVVDVRDGVVTYRCDGG